MHVSGTLDAILSLGTIAREMDFTRPVTSSYLYISVSNLLCIMIDFNYAGACVYVHMYVYICMWVQEIVTEDVVVVRGGRHPLQQLVVADRFVPNDAFLSPHKHIALVTGNAHTQRVDLGWVFIYLFIAVVRPQWQREKHLSQTSTLQIQCHYCAIIYLHVYVYEGGCVGVSGAHRELAALRESCDRTNRQVTHNTYAVILCYITLCCAV